MSDTRVFISYSRGDARYARDLSKALEARGVEVKSVPLARTDQDVQRDLERALNEASWYVVLISRHTLDSPWAAFELGVALGQGKDVVPVYLSDSAWRNAPQSLTDDFAVRATKLRPAKAADQIVHLIRGGGGAYAETESNQPQSLPPLRWRVAPAARTTTRRTTTRRSSN